MKTAAIASLILVLAECGYAQTGNIHGHITDLEGKPAAGETISIDQLGLHRHFETRSDSRGNYTHVGLPTGRYEISILHEGKPVKLNTIVRFGGDSAVDFDLRLLLPYDSQQK